MIKNPIITGFNPDPSIIRVEDDYYIATSTFEWFPGVQIHHSRDLDNWQLITRPLDRVSQLNLMGIPDSCGVWAPCLSYADGVYYLLYSVVKSFDGQWKDTPNYLVTARDIRGPWSEPVFLNSSGFDASLFHDNGKIWMVNMLMDHRGNRLFGGIILQEFDSKTHRLKGEIHSIFEGTEHGCTEAPHLYKYKDYYYLMLAEGGTGYQHCVTLARSRSLTGPYETHPQNPLLTSKDNPENYLQKTGHGDLVETKNGEWFLVFLTSRPLTQRGRCILGRETAIEKVEWRDDDWLYLHYGGQQARPYIDNPELEKYYFSQDAEGLSFNNGKMDINFQAPRVPITDDWANLDSRTDFLRLVGRDSLSSTFLQSMLARRIQAHHTQASLCVEFNPDNFQQMAGLVCYYNTVHYHYLHIRGGDFAVEPGRKFLLITTCDNVITTEPVGEGIDITGAEKVFLKADFNGKDLQFYYALQKERWHKVGPVLDGSILSDDYVANSEEHFHPSFTGAFYGICCQDLSGQGKYADFEWFEYKETEP